jgi:hypothetical protein
LIFNPFAKIGQLVAVQVNAVVNTSSPSSSPGQFSVTIAAPSNPIDILEGFFNKWYAKCSADVAEL